VTFANAGADEGPIVALVAALRWSRWPRFALGDGTVAFIVVLTDAEPSAEDTAILQSLMNAGHADCVEFMG
jgi:hypothetical protein